jgi:hypothetical protein
VARVLNLEAHPLEHRLEKPAEGDVFLADILLDFRTRPTALGVFCRICKPDFDDVLGLARIEGEDEIVEAQHAPGLRMEEIRSRASAFQKSGRWCRAFLE